MSGPIVYVVQNQHQLTHGKRSVPRFDLSPAKKFGELKFLLESSASPLKHVLPLIDLHDALKNYRAECDFLLLTGNPVLIGWAVAIAADYAHGRVVCLQWENSTRSYQVVRVDLMLSSRRN